MQLIWRGEAIVNDAKINSVLVGYRYSEHQFWLLFCIWYGLKTQNENIFRYRICINTLKIDFLFRRKTNFQSYRKFFCRKMQGQMLGERFRLPVAPRTHHLNVSLCYFISNWIIEIFLRRPLLVLVWKPPLQGPRELMNTLKSLQVWLGLKAIFAESVFFLSQRNTITRTRSWTDSSNNSNSIKGTQKYQHKADVDVHYRSGKFKENNIPIPFHSQKIMPIHIPICTAYIMYALSHGNPMWSVGIPWIAHKVL